MDFFGEAPGGVDGGGRALPRGFHLPLHTWEMPSVHYYGSLYRWESVNQEAGGHREMQRHLQANLAKTGSCPYPSAFLVWHSLPPECTSTHPGAQMRGPRVR